MKYGGYIVLTVWNFSIIGVSILRRAFTRELKAIGRDASGHMRKK